MGFQFEVDENGAKSIVDKVKSKFNTVFEKLGLTETSNAFVLVFSLCLATLTFFMLGLFKMLLILVVSFFTALFATGKLNFVIKHLWDKFKGQ